MNKLNNVISGIFLIALVFIFGCAQQPATEDQLLPDLSEEEQQQLEQELQEQTQQQELEEEIQQQELEEQTIPPEEPETPVEQPSEPQSAIKEFTMTAKQWDFTPSTITVNEGDIVKLTITSKDVTHGFNLPDFGVNERLEPGTTVNVEFVADKKGTFTFSCSVPCGSGHSRMSGTLIVN